MSNTKVLFVGYFRDATGWAQGAIDWILAMDAVGIDVVPRHYKLNNLDGEVPDRIRELEKKSAVGCTHIVQNLLPHHMEYCGGLRNIGLFVTESSINDTCWPERLSVMDEIWSALDGEFPGVNNIAGVIPYACDTNKFQMSYDTLDFNTRDDFLFYFVGENVARKNLEALLKAFHTEFRPEEPVQLVVKTSMSGRTPTECYDAVTHLSNTVKTKLKLYKDLSTYKKEVVVTERFSERGMMKLHNTCDCFVMPSRAEACCLPCLDALGMGNTPIVTAETGMCQYVNDSCGWIVPSRKEPAYGANDTFSDLLTGNDDWQEICIYGLREAMREAYENQKHREEKSLNGAERALQFGYHEVGSLIKDFLNEHKEAGQAPRRK